MSDHRPLSLCLLCALTDVDREQNSGPGEIRWVVRWQEEAGICKAIQQDTHRGQLYQAIEGAEVDSVGSLLQNIAMDAASVLMLVGRKDPRVVA